MHIHMHTHACTHIHTHTHAHEHTPTHILFTVPLGVTTFVVRSLSPYQISMSWERPDVTNGILTGYEVTVYNLKQYFSISISLSPSVLNYTISNGISECIDKVLDNTINTAAKRTDTRGVGISIV